MGTPPKPFAGSDSISVRKVLSAPDFIEPMQCLMVAELPTEPGWHWEVKWDGYRMEAISDGERVRLMSRNAKSYSDRFPEIVADLSKLRGPYVLDGEVVALDEGGRPSFTLIQTPTSGASTVFYAFDLLHLRGEDLGALPIEERRKKLEKFLGKKNLGSVRLSPSLEYPAAQVLEAVAKLKLEGVVGKRPGSLYESGKRSGAWVKKRTNRRQEFVIGGYLPGNPFDALLLGIYRENSLYFVAKLRAGFVPRERAMIAPLLKRQASDVCPFVNLPEMGKSRWGGDLINAEKMKECRWLRPELVVEVGFVEWTTGEKLRHPTYVAMRHDKEARQVLRET